MKEEGAKKESHVLDLLLCLIGAVFLVLFVGFWWGAIDQGFDNLKERERLEEIQEAKQLEIVAGELGIESKRILYKGDKFVKGTGTVFLYQTDSAQYLVDFENNEIKTIIKEK